MIVAAAIALAGSVWVSVRDDRADGGPPDAETTVVLPAAPATAMPVPAASVPGIASPADDGDAGETGGETGGEGEAGNASGAATRATPARHLDFALDERGPPPGGGAGGTVAPPDSYPVSEAWRWFVPRDERRAGNLGGPPPPPPPALALP